MCLACEQDAIWLAYLESQGLLKPDDPAAVEALFAAFPAQPLPMRRGSVASGQDKISAVAESNPFFCDDPKA
jgi:hypothetical protein